MTNTLADKVLFITGGSRGIGQAIALRAAQDGAAIAIAAKTSEPHPTLTGTIHSVAQEIEMAGGRALPLQVDVRYEDQITTAILKTIETFGKIDILINNASAIQLGPIQSLSMKQFDLLHQVNCRATYLAIKTCLPYLEKSENPHILTLSPPLQIDPKAFHDLAYSLSKFGMSLCTLGLADTLRPQGIAINSLWPKTLIATAAISTHFPQYLNATRKPAIVADAAHAILTSNSRQTTGQFFIDEAVLSAHGITSFDDYATCPGTPLMPDLYL